MLWYAHEEEEEEDEEEEEEEDKEEMTEMKRQNSLQNAACLSRYAKPFVCLHACHGHLKSLRADC